MIPDDLHHPIERIAVQLVSFLAISGSVLSLPSSSVAEEIDFSTCGYRDSAVPIPAVSTRAVVTPSGGKDDSPRIQAALDYVSELEIDANGFRGAVLLKDGAFIVRESLEIVASGVVLRGSGMGKTLLRYDEVSRTPMIRIVGRPDLQVQSENAKRLVDETILVGATQLALDNIDGLKTGQRVLITRPSTKEWIEALGMNREGISWKPGSRDVRWERRVVGIEGSTIALNAPVTTALVQKFGGARVELFEWPGRVSNVGVENLSLQGGGEDSTWCGVTMESVEDAWVRQVHFSRFPGSAVALWETTKNVTVQDCISTEPVSEIGGYRRHTYFTMGQQTLFLRCWSEFGWHDFAVGHCAAGPNAFVQCQAHNALNFSGTLESWASGVLFDNVTIDGAGLHLENRWRFNGGVGWSAANCTIWQSNAAEFRCFNPPGAANRAVATWGTPAGDGHFEQTDEFASPRSLFKAQLASRLGSDDKTRHLGPIGRKYMGATNPSLAEAEKFVANSSESEPTLQETIIAASEREPLWNGKLPEGVVRNPEPKKQSPSVAKRALSIQDGQLHVGYRLLRGKRFTPIWWRGNIRPAEAPSFGPAITRFVPGRIGRGFTDDLNEVTDEMLATGVAVVEHHHGLWYDRRRDDHTRVRRADGNVVPPFYEQPFSRVGTGTAWDGLSQYDLTRFNLWYWHRLETFADLCDQKGLVLFNQHYFQHNVLEAGAHWTDFPWREANNINTTSFPEPPPYIGDKRIFHAHLFYDVSNEFRRPIHRRYIRKHLDAFADNTNVIHSVGAEFTGPLEFVEFWIDTILDWESDTGKDAKVCLSCTKDVQDAILEDPIRGEAISVVDIRQWWYTSDGKLYAPEGGKNLSPRQHARRGESKSPSGESRMRAIREYRERHPDKAILFRGEP